MDTQKKGTAVIYHFYVAHPPARRHLVCPPVPQMRYQVPSTRDILRRTVEFIQNNINSTTI
jgi:hypothetical protein